MIKRIELKNFMSHSHTVIEPSDGLTVLVGPNNCGKSAVMAALQILCHNDTSTYVTRHGEKECSIKVVTTDGHEIEWSRNRTTSRYVINGETYDRLRGKVPEPLLDVLKLPKVVLEQSADEFDIHFGSQKQPVFLLNEPGRASAGFFAASSDASRLIEMQKLHRQRVKDANRGQIRLENEAETLNEQMELFAPLPALQKQFDANVADAQEIEKGQRRITQLRQIINATKKQTKLSGYLAMRNQSVMALAEPPEVHPTERLGALTRQLRELQHQLSGLERTAKLLVALSEPPAIQPTAPLGKLASEIRGLQLRQEKLSNQQKVMSKVRKPEVAQPTDRLRKLIRVLRARMLQFESNQRAFDVTQKVLPPPKIVDTQPLREIIEKKTSLQDELVGLEKEAKQLSKQSKQLDETLETFSDSNPICPTCNQPLSRKQIVASVKGGCDA